MSDQVSYLVGDTKFRDHLTGFTLLREEIEQYFGADSVTLADELWPVDVTLKQAMAISWRVKKWKLTGSCSISETTTDEGFGSQSAIGSAIIDADVVLFAAPDNHIATRERDIVSYAPGPPFNPLSNFGSSSITDEPISTWSTHVTGTSDPYTAIRNTGVGGTGFSISTGASLWIPDTKKFSPNISGPGKIIGSTPIGPEAFLASAAPNRNPITLLSGIGTAFMAFPGTLTVVSKVAPDFIIPMQLAWRRTGQAVTTVFSGSGTLELTLEAREFWPHQNLRGEDVYNIMTGEQEADLP